MSQVKQRYSKQRETILNILRNDFTHPNVDYIFMKVREIIPDISLGTVYRNLNLLADQGDIVRLDVKDGTIEPHFHMLCKECGSIEDIFVDESIVESFVDLIEEKSNSCIESVDLLFHGTCKKCISKEN